MATNTLSLTTAIVGNTYSVKVSSTTTRSMVTGLALPRTSEKPRFPNLGAMSKRLTSGWEQIPHARVNIKASNMYFIQLGSIRWGVLVCTILSAENNWNARIAMRARIFGHWGQDHHVCTRQILFNIWRRRTSRVIHSLRSCLDRWRVQAKQSRNVSSIYCQRSEGIQALAQILQPWGRSRKK